MANSLIDSVKTEIVMSIALFWGVGLAALGWLAFEIAESGQD
jgi:hypothetical protein